MMGRKKTINKDLPPRLFVRQGKRGDTYYYTGVRPAVNLGRDRTAALRKWAELESGKDFIPQNFRAIAQCYLRDIIPTKAPRTQQDNMKELDRLNNVFGDMPIAGIKPRHVKQYIALRSAKVRANREKALLSHIINYARERGYTDAPNPCQGIQGNREKGRDRYVTDHEYHAVWTAARDELRDLMDLMLYTGQRPADILKMRKADIRDGALWIKQNKTGAKVGISIEGRFAAIVQRITSRDKTVQSLHLVSDHRGQPISTTTLRSWFRSARKLAGADWQLRDLRAKNATDTGDLEVAKKRLAHSTIRMTEHYTKHRIGERVKPLK